MKSRFTARFDNAVRTLPYLLSVSAMNFAVACGNKNDKASPVGVQPKPNAQQTAEQQAQQKLVALFPKTDLSNPANLDLAQRIEGATVHIAAIDDESKSFGVGLSLLVRPSSADKKAIQVHASGEIAVGLDEAIKKAKSQKDDATARELFKRSFLVLSEGDSSPEAKSRYLIQAFCINSGCQNLGVRILEADDVAATPAEAAQREKEGNVDESRVKRQISIEFARVKNVKANPDEPDQMRIVRFNISGVNAGRGAETQKVDSSKLTKLSFDEAAKVREKDDSISPSARDGKSEAAESTQTPNAPTAAPTTATPAPKMEPAPTTEVIDFDPTPKSP